MSYYLDIIDTVSDENQLIIEQASKSGIVLEWSGGDKKDDLAVVGSNLIFDFAHREKLDAKFIKYFTGNETRFRAQLKNTADDVMIWQGHVLPDQYAEPFTNSVTFVKFTASCGLGRLKGKYLPDDFYRDEKSLIQIYCKILSLTSVNIDLLFNPAIENSVQKDWNEIYLDTTNFFTDDKKTKKQDAYAILEDLLKDSLCVCFQANNYWQIEGINKRHVRAFEAKRYNIQTGEFIGVVTGQKLLKKLPAFVEPYTTMVPPYNMISVTHERVPQSLPKTIAKESNEGWAVVTGVVGEIYSTDWNGNNGYYAKATEPDYYNTLLKYYDNDLIPPPTEPFSDTDFVNLKNKIFVYKYQKVNVSAKFKPLKWSTGLTPSSSDQNPFYYQFLLNDVVIFGNYKPGGVVVQKENFEFKDDEYLIEFEMIMPDDGLVDVKLFRSGIDVYTTNIKGFEIREMKISPIAFNEELIVTDVINDDFTIDKEIELNYSDDDTAFSKAFRLAKINEATVSYNEIEIPVISSFTQFGNFYTIVSLEGANLIKDNINTVVYDGDVLQNLEVIYNYAEAGEMVVKTDFAISTGNFLVKVYKNNDVSGSRAAWLQWTDAVYKIETERYQKTVCNIIRRMFNVASEKIDLVVNGGVKFNDLVLFKYVYDKHFVVTNCSWNLDEGKTTLTMSRAIYRDSGDTGPNPENIPPVVNAGTDIVLENDQTTADLNAEAFDVDGFIVSQQWVKTIGGFGDIIISPTQLSTALQNLTEDQYQYQITVTDNDGATAVDTINLIRRKDYTITLPFVSKVPGPGLNRWISRWNFVITPNIAADFNLKLKGSYFLAVQGFSGEDHVSIFRIFKNGVLYFEDKLDEFVPAKFSNFDLGYISTGIIIFETEYQLMGTNPNLGWTSVKLEEIDFVNGSGNILGLPVIVGDLTDGGFTGL